MPTQGASAPNPNSQLSRTPDNLLYTGDILNYRINGLTPYNLERLRVTLKAFPAERPNDSHIDTIDLYQSRSREAFADSCARYLKTQANAVMAELSLLINALEIERVAMREGSDKVAAITLTDTERNEALAMLKSKDLLDQILSGFDGLGYIGERNNKLLGILAAVSRLLPDPLALLILSRPGAGKTKLQEAICKLIPEETAISYTRLTGQSLFYREPNALKNKVLAIEEEDGMKDAMYSIKTLISSQKLSIAATRTDAKTGKFSVDEYVVNGPVVVMVSTTNPDALDDETRQRFLMLTIDESAEQTKKILIAQRTKNTHHWYQNTSDEPTLTRLHQNMQRLLKPLTVTFPDSIKIRWPYGRLQMRREQGKFLSLVKASTLLFQHQRKTGTIQRANGCAMEFVQATQYDVELAMELAAEVFIRNIDDVPPIGRTLLKCITALVNEKLAHLRATSPDNKDLDILQVPFSRKELRQQIGWSETQVRRICEHLVELGYLGRLGGRQGAACRYVLLDNGEDDPVIDFRGLEPQPPEEPKLPKIKNQ
jgi:hypothetical protein